MRGVVLRSTRTEWPRLLQVVEGVAREFQDSVEIVSADRLNQTACDWILEFTLSSMPENTLRHGRVPVYRMPFKLNDEEAYIGMTAWRRGLQGGSRPSAVSIDAARLLDALGALLQEHRAKLAQMLEAALDGLELGERLAAVERRLDLLEAQMDTLRLAQADPDPATARHISGAAATIVGAVLASATAAGTIAYQVDASANAARIEHVVETQNHLIDQYGAAGRLPDDPADLVAFVHGAAVRLESAARHDD